MGKEIVYCVGCGTGLYEDDFRKRRAVMVNDRPYCPAHAPATSKPEPTTPRSTSKPEPNTPRSTPSPTAIPRPESTRTRKPATGRVPLATPPPPARRPAPAQPESSTNTTLIIGGVIVALVIIMVIFVMGGSSREPARSSYPPPDERPAPRVPVVKETPVRRPDNPGPLPPADVLRELERNVQNKSPDEILSLCERARSALKGSPQEDRLRQIEEQARYSKVEPAINRIRGMTQADPAFKRRGEVLREIASAQAAAGGKSQELDRLKTDYDRSYEEAATRQAESTRADAERLSGEKKVDEAIKKCDEFLAVFAASGEGESIRKLRSELESKRNQ